jgi:hypothetical protein
MAEHPAHIEGVELSRHLADRARIPDLQCSGGKPHLQARTQAALPSGASWVG